MNEPANAIRLNKFLSEMGICSRREADRLIESGMVFVDGRAALTGEKVCAHQKIICNGVEVGAEKNNQGALSAQPRIRTGQRILSTLSAIRSASFPWGDWIRIPRDFFC